MDQCIIVLFFPQHGGLLSTIDKEGLSVLDITMKDRPSHVVFKPTGKKAKHVIVLCVNWVGYYTSCIHTCKSVDVKGSFLVLPTCVWCGYLLEKASVLHGQNMIQSNPKCSKNGLTPSFKSSTYEAMLPTVFAFSLQTQQRCTHGETILISVSGTVIRRADNTLSWWMLLPGREFTSSRLVNNTLLLYQLSRE